MTKPQRGEYVPVDLTATCVTVSDRLGRLAGGRTTGGVDVTWYTDTTRRAGRMSLLNVRKIELPRCRMVHWPPRLPYRLTGLPATREPSPLPRPMANGPLT